MGAFGAGREFGGVLRVVLAFGNAGLAVPKPRPAAVEAKSAGELPSIASAGLVRTGHGTSAISMIHSLESNALSVSSAGIVYSPIGLD